MRFVFAIIWCTHILGFLRSCYNNENFEAGGSKHFVSYNCYKIGEVNKTCAFVLKSANELKSSHRGPITNYKKTLHYSNKAS